ncbi:MAG: hypothetical protein WCB27_08355 [Thermoguttaceae bacterium]
METTAPANRELPNGHRWQFSLRQMFVAITGVAILLGWASWGGWGKSDAVVYLSIAFSAGVFSRAARRCLVAATLLLILIGSTGVFPCSPFLRISGACATITCNVLDPWPFFVTAPAACFCTAFLRANRLISFWSLVLSLILGEWFTAAAIVYSCGYETLFQLLGFQNSDAFFRELALHQCFPKRFPGQLWYIGAPWLLGIVVGEIMAQRRKPSGGERQRV